ncbi:fucolectin-like [Tubulanus polymorphus]|uniref:fucolectin-like n=1 Tax=Tubulanus polymorphus TaxID=672921 RepID=UPI003DA49CD1
MRLIDTNDEVPFIGAFNDETASFEEVNLIYLRLEIVSCAHVINRRDGATNENVALGRTTMQSSNYRTHWWLSSTAVDGNRDPVMGSGSCTHTNSLEPQGKPLWWKVCLGARYRVTSVILVNRAMAAYRLEKFKILVTTDESPPALNLSNIPQNTICAKQEAQMKSSEVKEFFCPGHVTGNTVIVTKPSGTGALSLCEVEVYGVVSTEELSLELNRRAVACDCGPNEKGVLFWVFGCNNGYSACGPSLWPAFCCRKN